MGAVLSWVLKMFVKICGGKMGGNGGMLRGTGFRMTGLRGMGQRLGDGEAESNGKAENCKQRGTQGSRTDQRLGEANGMFDEAY